MASEVNYDPTLTHVERRSADAGYVRLEGEIKLQHQELRTVSKAMDELRTEFREGLKDHREETERMIKENRSETDRLIGALQTGLRDVSAAVGGMKDTVKAIKYILIGGVGFYVLDAIGLKAFLIKIAGM